MKSDVCRMSKIGTNSVIFVKNFVACGNNKEDELTKLCTLQLRMPIVMLNSVKWKTCLSRSSTLHV